MEMAALMRSRGHDQVPSTSPLSSLADSRASTSALTSSVETILQQLVIARLVARLTVVAVIATIRVKAIEQATLQRLPSVRSDLRRHFLNL